MSSSAPAERDPLPRRSFFSALFSIGSAWIAALWAIPVLRAALYPLRTQDAEASWSDIGPLENFSGMPAPASQLLNLQRRDGWQLITAQQTVYVIGGPGQAPRVLSSVCPHLGCTVAWRPEKNEFICPCHGGTYAPDGNRISGPPARGMDELPSRVENGRLLVQFQTYRQLSPLKEVAD
jgi:menaquinol-cytochrome c reductase iron-sulfur subunit